MFYLEHHSIPPKSCKILLPLNTRHTVPKFSSDIQRREVKSPIYDNICKVFWFGEQIHQTTGCKRNFQHSDAEPKISAIEHVTTRASYMYIIQLFYARIQSRQLMTHDEGNAAVLSLWRDLWAWKRENLQGSFKSGCLIRFPSHFSSVFSAHVPLQNPPPKLVKYQKSALYTHLI